MGVCSSRRRENLLQSGKDPNIDMRENRRPYKKSILKPAALSIKPIGRKYYCVFCSSEYRVKTSTVSPVWPCSI